MAKTKKTGRKQGGTYLARLATPKPPTPEQERDYYRREADTANVRFHAFREGVIIATNQLAADRGANSLAPR